MRNISSEIGVTGPEFVSLEDFPYGFEVNNTVRVNSSVPFDPAFYSISTTLLLHQLEKGSRCVIWDNRDLLKQRGIQLSLIQSPSNNQFLEVTYFNTQHGMQHIQSKPISILNSWSHILFRVSIIVDKPLLSLLEVYLNGKQLISREAERRSHSKACLLVGSGVDGRDFIAAAFGSLLIYSLPIFPENDWAIRSQLSLQSAPILMNEEVQLRIVILPTQSELKLIKPHEVVTLNLEPTHISTYTLKRIVVPSTTSSSSTVSNSSSFVHTTAYSILSVPRYQRPSLPLSECKSVECMELFLQQAPHSEMIEGTYQYTIPPHLRKEWESLFDSRAVMVKRSMQFVWDNYRNHAWGFDELRPVSGSGRNNWGGIGMTLVDSLDTLWVMDMKEEFDEAVQWIDQNLHFNQNFNISVFEFTIRVVGGLLSGYHLSNDERLKKKAIEAGNVVLDSFKKGVFPHTQINLATRIPFTKEEKTTLAEFGTLTLELRELGAVTRNPKYAYLINQIYEALDKNTRNHGLLPEIISLPFILLTCISFIHFSRVSGAALNMHYSISGCSDSYYEYLLKGWIQSGKKDQQLRFHYNEAIEGVIQLLLMKNKRSGWQFLGELMKKRVIHSMQTLTCFAPGMMFLDLYHSNNQSAYRQQMNRRNERVARSVLYTCFMMCNSTTSGLPPESCSFSELKGMTISQRLKHYALRPEIIESFFLLKEVTGDPIAQEWGWLFYQAIETHCRAQFGYGMYSDVHGDGAVQDFAESFFTAETLKYLYLLFSSKKIVDFDKEVLTTEAHILPIRG